MITLQNLQLIHRIVTRSRKLHFTTDVPGVKGFLVNKDVDTIEYTLGSMRWEDGSVPSYYYEGEDLNLRRPAGQKELDDHGFVWIQDHVRWFETTDGRVWGICHEEPGPNQHPGLHYHEVGFSWANGKRNMERQLTDIGWDFEIVHRDDVELAD